MARHDYHLPACWPEMSAEERDRWFKGERARRQALRQDTTVARRAKRLQRRRNRRSEARAGTVSLEAYR